MSKLIISGKKSYTKRMFKHLQKEHPSTRHRMILRDKLVSNEKCEHVYDECVGYNNYFCVKCGKSRNTRPRIRKSKPKTKSSEYTSGWWN